jgi:hypothetical protein
MKSILAVLIVVGLCQSTTVHAQPAANQGVQTAEPRIGFLAAITIAWKAVPSTWKDKLKSWAVAKLKSLGRRFVNSDDGPATETMSVSLGQQDVDGDGDDEFVIHSDLEDHDGDGQDDDPIDDVAQDEGQLHADFDRMLEQQHHWLVAHGR